MHLEVEGAGTEGFVGVREKRYKFKRICGVGMEFQEFALKSLI
jgi:hypothetical protein